jgi:hypothetical protein
MQVLSQPPARLITRSRAYQIMRNNRRNSRYLEFSKTSTSAWHAPLVTVFFLFSFQCDAPWLHKHCRLDSVFTMIILNCLVFSQLLYSCLSALTCMIFSMYNKQIKVIQAARFNVPIEQCFNNKYRY